MLKTEEIPATGHSSDEGTVTKEPTCTEAGEKTYKCTVCGEVLKTEEIAALGHDWDEGKIIKEPTLTEEGTKEYVCKRDPSHVRSETIPKLTPTPVPTTNPKASPKTGDDQSVWRLSVLAVCTLLGSGLVFTTQRKKSK